MVEINTREQEGYRKVTDAFFYTSLSLIPIFAVPAFAALLLGRFLDAKFETDKMITFGLLIFAFISSWFITLKKAYKMNSEYKKVREEMKKEEIKQ